MRPAPALAQAPAFAPGLTATLVVRREDITFENLSPRAVRVEVTVTNEGHEPSAPTPAVVSAAVLGAFVPWRPITALTVPALEPGESAVVSAIVPAPAAAPLGPPDRITPKQLLTALGLPDDDSERARVRREPRQKVGLPGDPLQMLAHGGVHWAGNLNVFVGGKTVERHLARALRVYPGRLNKAVFFVGSGRDAYRFDLRGSARDWNASLHDMRQRDSFVFDSPPLKADDWHEVKRTGRMLLKLCPPPDCGQGTVEVHVTQRSTGQTAVVEFSLDASAAGPGCFVV